MRGWQAALLLFAAGIVNAEAPAGYLLEFADGDPNCGLPAYRSSCAGAPPRTVRFEMQEEAPIRMQYGEDTPPAWAVFDAVWVYPTPAASDDPAATIEIRRASGGARLVIGDRRVHRAQAVPLDRWVPLEGSVGPSLWVRITPH